MSSSSSSVPRVNSSSTVVKNNVILSLIFIAFICIALINLSFFGYDRYYFIRVEVSDTDADELKQRFSLSRHIIMLIELEGSVDLVMRIYIGILQTKNLKTAKDELQNLTVRIKGIRSVTFNQVSYINQKALYLDEKDVVK